MINQEKRYNHKNTTPLSGKYLYSRNNQSIAMIVNKWNYQLVTGTIISNVGSKDNNNNGNKIATTQSCVPLPPLHQINMTTLPRWDSTTANQKQAAAISLVSIKMLSSASKTFGIPRTV